MECYHKEKSCSTCGKMGYLKATCRSTALFAADSGTSARAGGAGADATYGCIVTKETPKPWLCRGLEMIDGKLAKCPTFGCHGKRQIPTKPPAPVASVHGKEVKALLEAQEKVEEEE